MRESDEDTVMGKKIITISRTYGSGGRQVAKAIAEELGIHCYDKELINMLLSRM